MRERTASRPKIRIACDYCRSRHLKCDLGEPSCNACSFADISCTRQKTVNVGGRPRGRRASIREHSRIDDCDRPPSASASCSSPHSRSHAMHTHHSNGLVVVHRPGVCRPQPDCVIYLEDAPEKRRWLGAVSSRVLLYQLIPTCEALLDNSGAFMATMKAALAFYERADNELNEPFALRTPQDLGRPKGLLRRWLDLFIGMPHVCHAVPGDELNGLLNQATTPMGTVDPNTLDTADRVVLMIALALGSHADEGSLPSANDSYGRWLSSLAVSLLPSLLLPGIVTPGRSSARDIRAALLVCNYLARAHKCVPLYSIVATLARHAQLCAVDHVVAPELYQALGCMEEFACWAQGGQPILRGHAAPELGLQGRIASISCELLSYYDGRPSSTSKDNESRSAADAQHEVNELLRTVPAHDAFSRLRLQRLLLGACRAQLLLDTDRDDPCRVSWRIARPRASSSPSSAYVPPDEVARLCARNILHSSPLVAGDTRLQTATALDAAAVFDALVFLLVDGLCSRGGEDGPSSHRARGESGSRRSQAGAGAGDGSAASNQSSYDGVADAALCKATCTAALRLPAVQLTTTFDGAFRFYLRCAEIVEIAAIARRTRAP